MRSVLRWTGVALLVGLSALGAQSAIGELPSAESPGQQLATATQFGYALAGLLAAGALVGGRSWSHWPLRVWAGLITLTGGLAPVVWGGTALSVGLAGGVTGAAIAVLVVWLATRKRHAP